MFLLFKKKVINLTKKSIILYTKSYLNLILQSKIKDL